MPVDVLYPVRQQKPSGFLSLIQYFFSSRRQHTSYIGDWSSDVCSSDLRAAGHRASPSDHARGGTRARRRGAGHQDRRRLGRQPHLRHRAHARWHGTEGQPCAQRRGVHRGGHAARADEDDRALPRPLGSGVRASGGRLRELELAFRRADPIVEAGSTVVALPAGDRATLGPGPGKVDAQSLRLNLEERLGIRQARETMSTETSEPDAGRCRGPDRYPGSGGNDDLPTVRRRADASRGVNGQTNVPDIGQRRAAAMDPDTDPHLETPGPAPVAELTLDGYGRLAGGGGALEDRKELVGAGVDLAAASAHHGGPEHASHVVQEGAIAVAQLLEQGGGGLDVAHEEGDEPGGKCRATGRRVMLLRSQLAGDEPDGQDAVLLRGVQQSLAGALPGVVVLEGDLIEPGERILHVGLVVDR